MDKTILSKAIKTLKKGEVLVYPTDTLYGLGVDIFDVYAVEKLFLIKNRPKHLPIPVAISDFDLIDKIACKTDLAESLAKHFLPGKLTLILDKKPCVSKTLTAGSDKIAVRIPQNKIALELLSNFGPLSATSANIHSQKTPYVINEIKMQFKQDDISLFIDDGKLDGQPSTIVDATTEIPEILRKGQISKKEIMDAI